MQGRASILPNYSQSFAIDEMDGDDVGRFARTLHLPRNQQTVHLVSNLEVSTEAKENGDSKTKQRTNDGGVWWMACLRCMQEMQANVSSYTRLLRASYIASIRLLYARNKPSEGNRWA